MGDSPPTDELGSGKSAPPHSSAVTSGAPQYLKTQRNQLTRHTTVICRSALFPLYFEYCVYGSTAHSSDGKRLTRDLPKSVSSPDSDARIRV